MSKPKTGNKKTRRRLLPSGWFSSDADEIQRRRMRGANEAIRIEPLTRDDAFYGCYLTHSDSGQSYRVEIRSLTEHINSCDCPDHRVNGLGTCKHVEATLQWLQYRRKRLFQQAVAAGSPYKNIQKGVNPSEFISGCLRPGGDDL